MWIRSDHVELPPRARRIPPPKSDCYHTIGTTSACAENTAVVLACFLPQWNYLRVRGEYQATDVASLTTRELPPRARRILLVRRTNCAHHGTTSACAENTPRFARICHSNCELPPRARRIRLRLLSLLHGLGTTSACAENTLGKSYPEAPHGNYLRVRGEYRFLGGKIGGKWELPPRARRIHASFSLRAFLFGTTSACAENTSIPNPSSKTSGNYLRVRGEYPTNLRVQALHLELPPRARRIQGEVVDEFDATGTTSACAENTNHS